jgi:hypothetical protein
MRSTRTDYCLCVRRLNEHVVFKFLKNYTHIAFHIFIGKILDDIRISINEQLPMTVARILTKVNSRHHP